MRARYYSPLLCRFINADIVAGQISDAVTLNRFAYANGNPVSNIDPFGLCPEHGTWYDRDAAIRYADKYHDTHNPEYPPFDDFLFSAYYFVSYGAYTGLADCANFVSQCLEAGGMEQNERWYFYIQHNQPAEWWMNPQNSFLTYYYDSSGHLTFNAYNYCFSSTWSVANSQYRFFSNADNGYVQGDVITIRSADDIDDAIKNYNIQRGDLLYWSSDGGKSAHHATMINAVTESDILFTGHSSPAFDKSTSDAMRDNGETVLIVRLKDYF